MRECCPDGTLRAFLDRELPAGEMARLAAHMEECPRCGERCAELSARAERVLGLVAGLPEPAEAPAVRTARKPVAMPRRQAGRWVAAAAALAAGWAALTLLSPKPVQAPHLPQVPVAVREAPAAVAEVSAPPETPAVRPPVRVRPRAARRAFPAAPALATLAGFMALDDDPIDAGVVLRVALAAGQQADVIYSSDGRPRAIRMVNDGFAK